MENIGSTGWKVFNTLASAAGIAMSATALGEYADIMKDISEVIKNLSKAHHYRSKYSTKML